MKDEVGGGIRNARPGTGCHVEPESRVECDELVMGEGTVVEENVSITGGRVRLGRLCRIGAGSVIRVKDELVVGDRSVLGRENLWEVRRATVGRELWTGPQVRVGGGSWSEVQSELVCGYWVHLGMRAFVNTARRATIGNEVGIGTGSAVYTHGAYLSPLAGFPVSFAPVEIGDNCWLPGAVVNPGVRIGPNAVIGVGSVVTRDVPAGALAAGVPCRVIRERAFPREPSAEERRRFFSSFLGSVSEILADFAGHPARFRAEALSVELHDRTISCAVSRIGSPRPERVDSTGSDGDVLRVAARDGGVATEFRFAQRVIEGRADPVTEKLRDLLRRHGLRFYADVRDGTYYDWRTDV